VRTQGGAVTAWQQCYRSAPEFNNREWYRIEGMSPAGDWTASLYDSGQHGYNYPAAALPVVRAAIRRAVAKLVKAEETCGGAYYRHLQDTIRPYVSTPPYASAR